MAYHVIHWTGEMEAEYPRERLADLFDELFTADDEHPGVSVSHESEWSLTVYRSGVLVLEHLEAGEPKHLGPVDRATAVALMVAVADGRIDEVRSARWRAGYPQSSTVVVE